jgi:hypothetical protein
MRINLFIPNLSLLVNFVFSRTIQKHMKTVLLTLFFTATALLGFSHSFHVALAKAEYNSVNSTMEVTIELDAADFEHWLQDKGIGIKHIEMVTKNSDSWQKINHTLFDHFKAETGQGFLKFQLLGMEAMKDGRLFIYLVAENVKPFSSVNWTFSLLMDHDPGQQNKLEMTVNKKKYYAVFLQDRKTATLKLEK